MHYCGVVAMGGRAPARGARGGPDGGAADPAERALLRARLRRAGGHRAAHARRRGARAWARRSSARGNGAGRDCDALLRGARRGAAAAQRGGAAAGGPAATALAAYRPDEADGETGPVEEGAYRRFAAVRDQPGRRVLRAAGSPAARPSAIRSACRCGSRSWPGDHVIDDGGELWHRRIEELEAVACALCAHRYAVGHASLAGDPGEGVVVLPGSALPERVPAAGRAAAGGAPAAPVTGVSRGLDLTGGPRPQQPQQRDPLRRGHSQPAGAPARPLHRGGPGEPDLAELRELLRTAGVAVAGEVVQRRDRPDPDRYLGEGKLDELKREIEATPGRTWWPATTSCCRARSATWSRSSTCR